MKYLIASDIHGSSLYCNKLLERFLEEKADVLLLLGDVLYHGPRNDLPMGYAPKDVISVLNEIKDKIVCVRGNCDAEVDQMVLNFDIRADYKVIESGGKRFFLTHGHIYNKDKLPNEFQDGDILLSGHTHVPVINKILQNSYALNPGSTTIPKENSKHSYMTLENNILFWKDIENKDIYNKLEL